jgi:hypothetical protein
MPCPTVLCKLMPDSQIDLDEVTERERQINLMWKAHKQHAPWEKALTDWVSIHGFFKRAAWCFTRVAIGLIALASAVATFKGAWDVVATFTAP